MKSKFYKSLAVIGIISTLYAPMPVSSQNNQESADSMVEISDEEIDRYTKVSHTMSVGDTLSEMGDNLETDNIEKLEWLIDTYNRPLQQGDNVTIIEKESTDGIYYPYAIDVDYDDPSEEDLFLLGETEDLGHAIRVDYHDLEGLLRRSLWTNKRNHSLFDVALYELDFPLEGFFNDHQTNISSAYGDRKNPVAGIYGGPERGFHRGIDIPFDEGTPISSPLDGTMVAGYLARNSGEDGYDTFKYLGKIAEIRSRRIVRNESRQQEVHNITFQFFHISDYPEAIKEEFAERQLDERNISDANRDEFREWYLWILGEQDESKIYENFHHHSLSSYLFRRLNVNEGQVIAYGGNTGLSSGDHAHIGMLVNGSYVDPEEYYETHGEREGSISEDDLQASVEKYEAIDEMLR